MRREGMSLINLTPAETERLSVAIEELSRATLILSQVMRKGWKWDGRDDARKIVARELGNAEASINLLAAAHDIDIADVIKATGERKAFYKSKLARQPKETL